MDIERTATEQKSAIGSALEEQNCLLVDLDQELERLARKLRPIITPKPEKPSTAGDKLSEDPQEYILTSIAEKNRRIKILIDRISSLRSVLDC